MVNKDHIDQTLTITKDLLCENSEFPLKSNFMVGEATKYFGYKSENYRVNLVFLTLISLFLQIIE